MIFGAVEAFALVLVSFVRRHAAKIKLVGVHASAYNSLNKGRYLRCQTYTVQQLNDVLRKRMDRQVNTVKQIPIFQKHVMKTCKKVGKLVRSAPVPRPR